MVFDGREFAKEIEDRLPRIKAKLVVLLDPKNEAGAKYVELKRRMAERLGIEFEIKLLNSKHEILNNIKILISKLNNDSNIDGIMVQLPFFLGFRNSDLELVSAIAREKDVDGLREDSPFRPAAVRAVVEILNSNIEILNKSQIPNPKIQICVVGAKGMVGKRLVRELKCEGMDKEDFGPEKIRHADIVISCTGQAGLITGDMVKEGFAAIDIGYPKAEFTPEALAKASFFTPVPGGVGPVTVAMLFKNLVESVYGHSWYET